jgi:iron-sulfur cluster assembly protein
MGLEAATREGDAVIRCGDVTVFVDEDSRPLLQGTSVDFCANPGGFVFDNPNNCSSCGSRKTCGI